MRCGKRRFIWLRYSPAAPAFESRLPPAPLPAVDHPGAGLVPPTRFGGGDVSLVGRRGVALILTLLVHLLLLLLVLFTRPPVQPRKEDDRLTTFSVMPDPAKKEAGAKKEAPKKNADAAAATPTVEPPRIPPPVAPVPTVPKTEVPPSFIQLTPRDFAAADLSRLPGRGTGASGANGKGTSGAVAGPGEGPGGVQLYEAEWYRRPTDMELAGYMPANPPRVGWGLVACKTIENYHVENCQALGESPIGSGFARAVRQAAWQFLVRPPRIDGKPQVGAWVRIRIDYTQSQAPDGPAN